MRAYPDAMTSAAVERQQAYLLALIARAQDAGHELGLKMAQDPLSKKPVRYWAQCSCGYNSRRQATQIAAVMMAVWHVGQVIPLDESDRAEARRVGVPLPGLVGAGL